MRPKGKPEELERIRKTAIAAVEAGYSQVDVARIFGKHPDTLSKWMSSYRRDPESILAKPIPGRPPRLSIEQLEELNSFLRQGAVAHGWSTNIWTCPRVTEIIQRHFGVTFHPDHVLRIVTEKMKWSFQRPEKVARERDPKKVEEWLEKKLPEIKKKAENEGATLIYLDEVGFQLMPTRRRTLAPQGETPMLLAWDKRGKISTIGAITISPKTEEEGFLFQMLPDEVNFTGALVVDFLRDVGKHIPGPIKLIWDGAPIHRSKVVTDFLAKYERIETFRFPAYAPDTNPVEGCWGHSKYHQMPNLVPKNTDELRIRAEGSLGKIQSDRCLLRAFIKHAHNPSKPKSRLSLCGTQ